MQEIKLYSASIEQFITSLEKSTIAKVMRTIGLLEKFGALLGMPHSKKIAHGLFELRVHGAQKVRLMYAFRQNDIVLLHGFVKKAHKIPPKEIQIAKRRLLAL